MTETASASLTRLLPALVMAAMIVLVLSPEARSEEDRDGPYVETDRTGARSIIRAHNPAPYPITVTVELTEAENVRARPAAPVTRVVPPGGRAHMMTIQPQRRGVGWRYRTRWGWRSGSADARHDEEHVYQLPYAPGYAFHVSQGFDGSFSHQDAHALDWTMPEGTPLHAARGGRVVQTVDHFEEGGPYDRLRGRANVIWILHEDQTIARYVHLMPGGVAVEIGQEVEAGELIGYSGNTGFSRGPHLHFDIIAAEDGFARRTFPMRFDLGGGRTIDGKDMEGAYHMRPHDASAGPEVAVPLNAVRHLILSAEAVQGTWPEHREEPFARNDTLYAYLRIGVPGEYEITLTATHADGAAAPIQRTVRVGEAGHWTSAQYRLLDLEMPPGRWHLTAAIEGRTLATATFEVE